METVPAIGGDCRDRWHLSKFQAAVNTELEKGLCASLSPEPFPSLRILGALILSLFGRERSNKKFAIAAFEEKPIPSSRSCITLSLSVGLIFDWLSFIVTESKGIILSEFLPGTSVYAGLCEPLGPIS